MSADVVSVSVHDWEAARFKVAGLSVLERNLRELKSHGFKPVFLAEPPADSGFAGRAPVLANASPAVSRLPGDVQYPFTFFRDWRRSGSGTPSADVAADVSLLMRELGGKPARRWLEKRLFDEILRGTSGLTARVLNKRVSFALTRLLVRTTVTPNMVTVANFLLGVAGCCLLLSLDWGTRAIGAVLIQLSSILDGCDGEIAALKVMRSKIGGWLDTITDDVLNNLMFVCLYLGYYREFTDQSLLLAGIATSCASLGVSAFLYRYLIGHDTQNMADFRLAWAKPAPVTGGGTSWFDVAKHILKRDTSIILGMVLIILDWRLVLMGFFAPIWAAFGLYFASFLYEKTASCRSSIVHRPS